MRGSLQASGLQVEQVVINYRRALQEENTTLASKIRAANPDCTHLFERVEKEVQVVG